MAHNFQRPRLPYEGESLQNDKRYQLLTRANDRPATDEALDTDFNYLIDAVRQLDEDIAGVSAGILPGADDPENENFFPKTDGDGNISWTDVSDENVRDRSLSAVKMLPGTLTAFEMMDGTLTANKLAPNAVTTIKILDFNVTANKLAPDSATTEKIPDEAITAPKIAAHAVTTEKIVDGAVTLPKINALFPVTMGGTGLSTLTTPYGVICAGTTATGNFQNAGVGSLNQIFMGNGNAAVGSWKDLNTLAAAKADQITGNSTAVYTNPSVQQHHPSAAKFWCVFDGTLTGTNPPSAGYNVASITRVSTGIYRVNFIVPFSTTKYGVGFLPSGNANGNKFTLTAYQNNLTTSVELLTYTTLGVPVDAQETSAFGFGLQ